MLKILDYQKEEIYEGLSFVTKISENIPDGRNWKEKGKSLDLMKIISFLKTAKFGAVMGKIVLVVILGN